MIDDIDVELIDETVGGRLFVGDCGTMNLNQRVAYTRLVQGSMLTVESNKDAWDALIKDRELIEQNLSNLFLTLLIDHDLGAAIARQGGAESDLKFPKLMRRITLKLVEAAVLSMLRRAIHQVSGTDDFAVASLTDMQDEVVALQQFKANDEASVRRSVAAAVNKFVKVGIVKQLRGSDDRFTVHPMLRNWLPAEEVQALLVSLQAFDGAATEVDSDGDDEGDTDD